MSILPAGLTALASIVQDNTLVREFNDALFPELLYRDEAMAERWESGLGETRIMTRASLLAPVTTPLTAGADPVPVSPSYEQWVVSANQYSSSLDTSMQANWAALAPLFMRNAKTLGLQAGQSMNRLVRDALFQAYTGGDTHATAAGAAVTALPVDSIAGFTEVLVDGRPATISPSHPKTIMISGVAGTHSVTAASPTDPLVPLGPGTLTLAAAATWAADAQVRATDAPAIIRAGGAADADGLTAVSGISLEQIRLAVAIMRRNRVPTHADGFYHVHLDPLAESQLFRDNEFQRLNQSVPDNMRYARFAVGRMLGCIFITNNESPNALNSGTLVATGRGSAEIASATGAITRNRAGVGLVRSIVTGGGSIYERWIDESAAFSSEAGYTGKVGSFSIVNGGLQVSTDRVRYILRAPQDRLQQVVSQSWSFSGGWAIPSDSGGGLSASRFKRAVTIESGSND